MEPISPTDPRESAGLDLSNLSTALPPETLRRLAAYRRLLENADFLHEFLPGYVAAAREELDQLGDHAPEPELRRRIIRLNQASELERDMRQFVAQAETMLEHAGKGRREEKSSM